MRSFSRPFSSPFLTPIGAAIGSVGTLVGGGPLTTAPITAWGDSLTFGTGAVVTQKTYPTAASSRLTTLFIPKNRGIGGQTSTQIAARQGGQPLTVTVSGNSIPASGSVAITAKNINVLVLAGVFTGTITGSIAGIPGTMSTDASGNWTFTRTTPGSITAAAAGIQFILDEAVAFRNDTQWIMAGGNNPTEVAIVLADIAAMVAYLGHTRYRILPVLPSTAHNSTILDYIDVINTTLARTYGARYVDARAALFAANDGSANDLVDIAARFMPRSLRSDAVHLNDLGYETVGIAVARSYTAADQAFTPNLGLAASFGEFDTSAGWTAIGAGYSFANGRLLRDGSPASEIIRTVPAIVPGQSYRAIVRGYYPPVNVRNGAQYLTITGPQTYIDFVAADQTFGFQTGGGFELLNVSLLQLP